MLSNRGQPRVKVTNGSHANRGELELTHIHEGFDIQMDWAQHTLLSVARLWGRPVHLVTRVDDQKFTMSHTGDEYTVSELNKKPSPSRKWKSR